MCPASSWRVASPGALPELSVIILWVCENYSVSNGHNWCPNRDLNRDHLKVCFAPVPQARAREKDIRSSRSELWSLRLATEGSLLDGTVLSLFLSVMGSSLSQQLACKHQLSFLLTVPGCKFSDSDLTKLLKVIYTCCPWYPQEGFLKMSDWEWVDHWNGVDILNVLHVNTWNLCCFCHRRARNSLGWSYSTARGTSTTSSYYV